MRLFRNGFVVALLFACSPALADEGLPQLDISLFPAQLFWLAISFGVLYVLMSVVALPRVARTQANRKQVIAGEIEAARAANDAAKATAASVEKSLGSARAKAQASVSEMIAEVAEQAGARQATQEKELLRNLHRAEADIAVTRESALRSVNAGANELANLVVENIIHAKRSAA